jgi:hypothetical protein
MTYADWYFSRNPKFTDSFERDLANDDDRHIGRDEPSVLLPVLQGIVKAFQAVARSVRFPRASALQPKLALKAR